MKYTPLQELWFYCDETSHCAGQHMAVGGIALHANRKSIITQEFQKIKTSKNIALASEMKWEKINPRRIEAYKASVDYFFSLLEAKQIHFHIMIADHRKLNIKAHNDGSKEKTVSKLYYQLLKHRCCKFYGKKTLIHVRPDGGDCTAYLPQIIKGLNTDAKKTFGLPHFPIYSINCADSAKEPLLQLNDIIIGGIASYHNKRFLDASASKHKTEMAKYILQKFGWDDYSKETPSNAKKLTLWHYTPKR